ncbi:MAG: hypothetical protein E4H37_07880 [Gemmatimonadales bacterium]|nr:MAG: hypothetical protein E4H37_07880 [Gemmatimonadales bacterium]
MTITEAMVTRARTLPADSTLFEARSFYLYPIPNRDTDLEIHIADEMLRGRLARPGVDTGGFSLEFDSRDLVGVPPALRLWVASYAVPDFLLAAYVETDREEYFFAARDYVLGWEEYERRSWGPRGLLWNDHAIASRVRVLGEFWRLYRERPDYDPAVGVAVLRQAARYGKFLSDPAHFTFATNHGVMQNLGLLQLSLAFPTLPRSEEFRKLAVERLGAQMAFFMDEEGVIRENSAGYQAFGLEMLALTFRSLTRLETPVPPEWARRYARGLDFLARLRRPDGSLPVSGDTDGAPLQGRPRVLTVDEKGMSSALQPWSPPKPSVATSVFPAAGYWIDWDGLSTWPQVAALRQSVMTWSSPPPPGHKHADDLSVLIWSDGYAWLTGVGYWPYDLPGREVAESWASANGPHGSTEQRDSERTVALNASGSSEALSAVDVERRGPGDYVARRQLIHLRPDVWLIIDHVQTAGTEQNTSLWTIAPGIELHPGMSPHSFELSASGPAASMRVSFLGSPGTALAQFQGSNAPFAGWQVVDSRPVPTSAIAVTQPAGPSRLAVVYQRVGAPGGDGIAIGEPVFSQSDAGDTWELLVGGALELRRVGDQVISTRREGSAVRTDTLTLAPGTDVWGDVEKTRRAFEEMSAQFPRFQDQMSRRAKVTYLLLALLLAQEIGLAMIGKYRPGAERLLRVTGIVAWIGLAAWLHFSFVWSWATVPANVAALSPALWCLLRRPGASKRFTYNHWNEK